MAWQEDECRRVYAQRLADARGHLATLNPESEEHARLTQFIAELERSEFLKEHT